MTQKRTLVPFFDACGQLGYHPQHVRKLVKGGKLKAPVPLYDGGHQTFYTQEYIDEVIAKAIAPLHRNVGEAADA